MPCGSVAAEFEPYQPLSRALITLRCNELPFSGRRGRQASEILAWARALQGFVDDIACAIDFHTNGDIETAVYRIACAERNVG